MSRRIVALCILSDRDEYQLVRDIRHHLNLDYELYGNPYGVQDKHAVMMVRYAKESPNTPPQEEQRRVV